MKSIANHKNIYLIDLTKNVGSPLNKLLYPRIGDIPLAPSHGRRDGIIAFIAKFIAKNFGKKKFLKKSCSTYKEVPKMVSSKHWLQTWNL